MKFFKTFLACLLAVVVSFGVLMVLFFSILVGIVASAGKSTETVNIPDNSILHLTLDYSIVENAEVNPYDDAFNDILPNQFSSTRRVGLYQMIDAIKYAETDDRITGIYLDMPININTGWANLKSIRNALMDFKTSGKFVYAYSPNFQEEPYYLASVADSVFMPGEGGFEFNGFSVTPIFFKKMLDKIGVAPQIFKVGEYKSAVEQFERTNMSEPSRRQTQAFIDEFWNTFINDVSVSRNIKIDELNNLAETFITGNGKKAIEAGFVDELTYVDALNNSLKSAAGVALDDKVALVSLAKYIRSMKMENNGGKVAVIFAEGSINLGKSTEGVVGSETFIKAFKKVREDDAYKAVVLRINSPGGSALASDLMKDAIERTKKKKPVVVSMGDYAASGGYYISAPGSKIFAQPTTITGSIGVFGIFFQTQELFTDKIGITTDQVRTHPYAGYLNPAIPLDPKVKSLIQSGVEQTYNTFLTVVKEGRDFRTIEEVDKLAGGRVWAGKDALANGLVDEMGDLRDAIAEAVRMADIEETTNIELLPKPKSTLETLIETMGEGNISLLFNRYGANQVLTNLEMIRKSIPESGEYMLLPQTYYIH